jgi:phosphoenolpyruvate---glycerone phosphotransferase subunit DhaL
MDATVIRAWLAESTRLIEANKDYLTTLDSAIGDADHGVNLSRGFLAAMAALDEKNPTTPGAVLTTVGNTLVSKVGGASGPLYGTAFRRAGRALGNEADVSPAQLGEALEAATAGVRELGAANPGDKTMVDALVPAVEAFQKAVRDGATVDKASIAAQQAAEAGAEATTPMLAQRGRASYLGARSVGHKDPGAASTALLIQALATAVDADTR